MQDVLHVPKKIFIEIRIQVITRTPFTNHTHLDAQIPRYTLFNNVTTHILYIIISINTHA